MVTGTISLQVFPGTALSWWAVKVLPTHVIPIQEPAWRGDSLAPHSFISKHNNGVFENNAHVFFIYYYDI